MLKLKNHVIVVGPDRCFKTSLISTLKNYYENESYKGSRGDDADIEKLIRGDKKYIFDRGLICDRAYNKLLNRPVALDMIHIKEFAEFATRQSRAPYIFMTRKSFDGVKDNKNPTFDLYELSDIYNDLIQDVEHTNEVLYVIVDKVKDTDIATDPEWVKIVGRVMSFLSRFE